MASDAILEVRRLSKTYRARGVLRRAPEVSALIDVSLHIARGGTLALVGASGSGKSTLAMCLVRREEPTAGEIRFEDEDVLALHGLALRDYRRAVQMIPQDPGASLNPRFPAWRIVQEPALIAGRQTSDRHRAEATEMLALVGLPPRSVDWLPGQFSGGQRARLALARALSCRPRVLILDESLAGLDLSVQAQMINLLLDLQSRLDLTYILISHDLRLAGHFADEVAVVSEGRIVEGGAPAALFRKPAHAATQALVAAAARD
jgi:ABC-type glutathione transport system ATPase component